MIELELVGVRVELPHNQPIVLLRETTGERDLPIWIGAVEATAIAFALQGVTTARPMTHDLMRDLLANLEVQVDRVVVTELRDGTFYAEEAVLDEAGIEIEDDEEEEVEQFKEFLDSVSPEDFK